MENSCDLNSFLNVLRDCLVAVTVAEYSIFVELSSGLIYLQICSVWSQGLLVGPCLSISATIPEHTHVTGWMYNDGDMQFTTL